MKIPLLLQLACKTEIPPDDQRVPAYDTSREISIRGGPVATGTFMTKQNRDPTADETNDR